MNVGLFSKIRQISQVSQTSFNKPLIFPSRTFGFVHTDHFAKKFSVVRSDAIAIEVFRNQVVQAHLANYANFPNLALIKNVLDFIFEFRVD